MIMTIAMLLSNSACRVCLASASSTGVVLPEEGTAGSLEVNIMEILSNLHLPNYMNV